MKKKITIIITTIISLFLLTSCQKLVDTGTFIVDYTSNMVIYRADRFIWTGASFNNPSADEKYSIKILGKEYQGTYQNSKVINTTSYIADNYRDENGVEFSINSLTKELVYADLCYGDDNELYYDEIENQDEYLLEYAKKVASNYVNVDDYELINVDIDDHSKEIDGQIYPITYYSYDFSKKINDYVTSDEITLTINSKGHLASLLIFDKGAFDELKLPNKKLERDNYIKNIEKKLKSVYRSPLYTKGEKYTIKSYEIQYESLVKTPDGSYGIYAQVYVKLIKDSTNEECENGVVLLYYV